MLQKGKHSFFFNNDYMNDNESWASTNKDSNVTTSIKGNSSYNFFRDKNIFQRKHGNDNNFIEKEIKRNMKIINIPSFIDKIPEKANQNENNKISPKINNNYSPKSFSNINNYNKNNNKIEEEIEINYKNKEKHNTKNSNKNYVNNSNHNSNKKIFDSNKKYKINNNNIINNNNLHKKTISDRIKNKSEVSLPNVINENIVNKEIQNLFENIPNQLRNDPDLKEKVGELLNNINEMKAFIETKKEQKFKLKKNKSGNKEKIKLLNNKSENNLQNPKNEKNKNKQKVQVQMSQNNLINKRPPISERKINLLKNMNSNNNSNNNKNYNNNNNYNYNYNSIQKQIPHPSKINNIRYVDNNKI